jgi:hypothetical protein
MPATRERVLRELVASMEAAVEALKAAVQALRPPVLVGSPEARAVWLKATADGLVPIDECDCRERRRKYQRNWYLKRGGKAYFQARAAEKAARGECVRCSQQAAPGRRRCATCLEKDRLKWQKRKSEKHQQQEASS